jgi:preprotein translocase subunit SecG
MTLLHIAQIIIALMIIVVILAQVRGIERTLFRFTIVLVVVFLILSILSVRFV